MPIFSQKIGALNESNTALKERIDLLQKEKVRGVVCMKILKRDCLKCRVIHVHKSIKRALHECFEKVFVRKNKCPINHATLDACRKHKVWPLPNL